ncbi:histidine kinase [Draconibacterium sp. IB214405]|uniref:sensor histidine kinase n=1 Tax=Draconibacterium sp. IB214405 TaxID=3097352 RepID=UPI002A135A6B|nr:ATP-binding protein [Draconibacterium sp. IB214405]MDX8339584.1 histidine kinase [Draconibacterium sp. IB214405]
MSLKILFRGRVLLAIIIFTTITCTGIIYTSIKSLRLDREHLSLLELSKNIDLEISHSRIFLDDYFLLNESPKKAAVLSCFSNAGKYTTSLNSLIAEKYKGNNETDLQSSLEAVIATVEQLQNRVSTFLVNNPESFDTAVLTDYRNFQLAYQELDNKLEQYIQDENSQFKQSVFTLVLLTFFLLLLCIFLIQRIINSYNTIEKQQALRALEVEFKERKRIAADLHDGLGSILSSIALFIKLIEKDCSNNAENKSLIQVKELSGIALENLEATINNLNPSILNKYGLIKSLEILCDKINDIGEVTCSVNSADSEIKLDPNMELNMYRICNELINNTLKHAGASILSIDIQQIKKTVVILYRDNGKGFNPDLIPTFDEEKMGLRNIIKRIESFGGKYAINSGEGKGVEIMLSINL